MMLRDDRRMALIFFLLLVFDRIRGSRPYAVAAGIFIEAISHGLIDVQEAL